jgi:DNA modification methylase
MTTDKIQLAPMKRLLQKGELWKLHEGDCIPHMHEMPEHSVDFTLYSPPFPAVYSYSNSVADIGNSENLKGDAKLHLSFFFQAIRRVLKPGRVMVVHCWQLPRLKRTGGVGLHDFRGLLIRLGERAGFVYEYDWLIRKNPQSEAIRTRARELQFAGLESDRAKCRGSLADYLIKFRAPGDNEIPIRSEKGQFAKDPNRLQQSEVSRKQWIKWAESHWTDIDQTDTLNVKEGRGKDDTRHICPLQLGVISRLIKLFSNPNEIVFTPFAGIGSELYGALKLGRRAYGCELKREYFAAAQRNCSRALASKSFESNNLGIDFGVL